MSFWESHGKSDEWYTPKHVFDALECAFDLDVAAPPTPTSVPARRFLTTNSLASSWDGFVWMNPPFGGRNGLVPWLEKFFEHGNGVALVPDRTSAPWFQYAWQRTDAVLFTPKLKFLKPDGSQGKSPSNGTALMATGKRGREALHRAAANKLGILGFPARGLPDP